MNSNNFLWKWFSSERMISKIFWITSFIAFCLNLFDFLPQTRRVLFSDLISFVLSMDNALYEILQIPLILFMIWMVYSKKCNPKLKEYPFFRWGTFVLLILVFFEEISWGAVFIGNEHYEWLVPYAKGVDFHNYELSNTDASELIEAVVGIGICIVFIPVKFLRKFKSLIGIPDFEFSTFQYQMLIFANFTGFWAMFQLTGKHDIFYENMTFFTIIISLLRFNGLLKESFPTETNGWLRATAYITTLAMPLKFYILYHYDYFKPFAY